MFKVPRLPHKVTIGPRAEIPWRPIYIAESHSAKASHAQSTTPATQSYDWTARRDPLMSYLHCGKRSNDSFGCSKYHACHTKWRWNRAPIVSQNHTCGAQAEKLRFWNVSKRIFTRKSKVAKTSKNKGFRTGFHNSYIAESDSAKASCAQSTTPATQSHDWTARQDHLMSYLHCGKRFSESFMCSKYHACHTKWRSNTFPKPDSIAKHNLQHRPSTRQHAKIDVLLQFRAIDTHDPTKGLRAPAPKSTFYYSFARSTRTILRKGCARPRQNRRFTTVSRDRHTRFHVKHKVSQAFSGPGRP